MFSILLVIQILVSIAIIVLVMLQHGKGADMGAAFGSGSSGTVFGSRGSGSFFTRATGVLATVFFINCLLIASPLIRNQGTEGDSIAGQLEQQVIEAEENAIVEALEQQADLPGEIPALPVVEDDVPGGQPEQPAGSDAEDLPQ